MDAVGTLAQVRRPHQSSTNEASVSSCDSSGYTDNVPAQVHSSAGITAHANTTATIRLATEIEEPGELSSSRGRESLETSAKDVPDNLSTTSRTISDVDDFQMVPALSQQDAADVLITSLSQSDQLPTHTRMRRENIYFEG